MAEAIITSFAQGIIGSLVQIAADETSLIWGFKGELGKLEKRLDTTIAFLSDAEGKPATSSAVTAWLRNLKGAVYDADGVLDEFQYENLRQKTEIQGRCLKKVTEFFSISNNPLAFRLKLAHKIRNINLKISETNKEASELGLHATLRNAPKHTKIDSSHYGGWGGELQKIVGRDMHMFEIVDFLVDSNNGERLSVISIVGMAGQGKTALAHLVCGNDRVVRHFDKIIWVSVSDDFQETRILDAMVEFLHLKNLGLSNKYAIVERLKEDLKEKKYLLVLDDVWNEVPSKWKSLKNALEDIRAPFGSKIMVTTRNKNVAVTMETCFTVELEGLAFDDGWTVFEQKAFAEGGPSKTPKMVEIGGEIVRRCGGVPLVIDVLGRLLHSKTTEDEWLLVRDNKMWASLQDINDLAVNILRLSYDHLSPPSLKNCFSYSSILPKDSDVNKDSVVQMWMALGLLSYSKGENVELEDVGDAYFDMLLEKSLLQEAKLDDYGNIEHCKMHDLVHDLAQQTSEGYCLTLSGSNEISDEYVVHLSLLSPTRETLELAQGRFIRLQTLFFEGPFFGNICENLRFLRVLVLVDHRMDKLPASIGNLKHLRYLDVVETDIKALPSSTTKLYNLQTLRVGVMEEIPKGFGNLINLRHFYGEGILTGVGKLTSLQTLQVFIVSRAKDCRINELGGLTKLKGKLAILSLEDVENSNEAESAKLSEKSRIQSLEFKWEWSREVRESNSAENVLEGLKPHSNLKSLKIGCFKGLKLSTWMMSDSFVVLKNLIEIQLEVCDRCEQLPTLGHLPYLRKVKLSALKKVKKIGAEFYGDLRTTSGTAFFPKLRELSLVFMDSLEAWLDVKEVTFPKLEKFGIRWSVKLQELPNSLFKDCKNLQELSITYCDDMKVIPDVGRLASLRKLEILYCDALRGWPRGIQKLTSLQRLTIRNCDVMAEPLPDLRRLTRLEALSLGAYSDELNEVPTLPSSLQTLTLYRWPNGWPKHQDSPQGSEAEPEWLGNLPLLQSLAVGYCRKLKSMPSEEIMRRLKNLKRLYITHCPHLSESCIKGRGTDWHKIQHIPYIQIDHKIVQDIIRTE